MARPPVRGGMGGYHGRGRAVCQPPAGTIHLKAYALSIHTGTPFKYMEGGPDREAPEVV